MRGALYRQILLGAVLAAGCSRLSVDLESRPCREDNSCLEGYACDPKTHLCVTTGQPCGDNGRYSPCDGSIDCTVGCRQCRMGVWSDCSPIDGGECVPSTTVCQGAALVTCNAAGFIESSSDCGPIGCNSDVDPAVCNPCEAAPLICSDIDECATGTDDCDSTHEVCQNELGTGWTCLDIDECATGTDDCHGTYEVCQNEVGSGWRCDDIDECALGSDNCDPTHEICQNALGSGWRCLPGSSLCGSADENSTVSIACPVGMVITAIDFASYGTPTGLCGAFAEDLSCHAVNSPGVVERLCLNQTSCLIPATNGEFTDPCVGTFKHLYVAVTCT